jgi:hypothetical protein
VEAPETINGGSGSGVLIREILRSAADGASKLTVREATSAILAVAVIE